MTGIFINYRVDDDASAAALVDERLCREFGDDKVFRDSRSLDAGIDFDPELWRRLKLSGVLLALIGPRWLTLADADGRRRLDDPRDYVRREIRYALKRDRLVIPLLLNDTPVPRKEQLPSGIRAFARQQFLELRVRNVAADLKNLVTRLAVHVPRSGATSYGSDGAGRDARERAAGVPGDGAGIDGRHTSVHLHGDGHTISGDIFGGDKNDW